METQKQQALETFNWWFSQAKKYYLLTGNPGLYKLTYRTLCCLQQAAEYIFKAIIISLTGRELKTRNPYILIQYALPFMPEINNIFPRHTLNEKKIFHSLKPSLFMERNLSNVVPGDDELQLLAKRICQLITTVEAAFLDKIKTL